jgi:hypothetical protein
LSISAIHKIMSKSISPNGNQLARGRKKQQVKEGGIPVRFNPAIPKEKLVAAEKAVRKYLADLEGSK